MAVYVPSQIPFESLSRFSSGHGEIDWLLGSKQDGWGFVRKSLTLWGGEAGVGKTRFINGLCKLISKRERILYFQLEMTLQSFFIKYCKNVEKDRDYLVSDSASIEVQIKEIEDFKPTLVVIDSINKVREFTNSDKSIKACEAMYRDVANRINCHVALITHLNMTGGIKGGNGLRYMVDTVIAVKKNEFDPNSFSAEIDKGKNRFGKPDKSIQLKHQDRAVQVISQNRFNDPEWVEPSSAPTTNFITPDKTKLAPPDKKIQDSGKRSEVYPQEELKPLWPFTYAKAKNTESGCQDSTDNTRKFEPAKRTGILAPVKNFWAWLKSME